MPFQRPKKRCAGKLSAICSKNKNHYIAGLKTTAKYCFKFGKQKFTFPYMKMKRERL